LNCRSIGMPARRAPARWTCQFAETFQSIRLSQHFGKSC
jgi:hypothetical protein